MIISPYKSYPPKWSVFNAHAKSVSAKAFRFSGSVSDVNRFAARYRAAICFKRVEFDELSQETTDGYSSLVELLLAYSAFEHLLRCIGVELKNSLSLLRDDEQDRSLASLKSLQGSLQFFDSIRKHLDPQYQRQVDAFKKGQSCNPFYLAAAIRHAFAHGKLAATQVGAPEGSTGKVCRNLRKLLIFVMKREFLERIESYEKSISGPRNAG